MTGARLDLNALAAESGVPVETLRRYDEVGVLAPARHDGDRSGYPPAEAGTVRLAAGAENLGLDDATLTPLAADWRDEGCSTARQRLVGSR